MTEQKDKGRRGMHTGAPPLAGPIGSGTGQRFLHDFNNLISVIAGSASLIEMQRDVSPGAKAAAARIQEAAGQLSHLVRERVQ